MSLFIALITLSLLGLIGLGLYLELAPKSLRIRTPQWWKGLVGTNLLTFVVAQIGLLVVGTQEALAAAEGVAAAPAEISLGMGLAMIGAGLPTAISTLAAGIAVGPVGAASLAAITDKPEIFGRSLVYMGLAEGIAIYGLVISILMLNKI